ncbi:hypothetical protein QFC19_008058 [Naganishia cerealis]|uniref:Uncharacterized protein n=1 Tax=Naganishia cerealis TaxID=610337 RepID=A0ACC2V612_9TREE|nr:hypothetical protein QFC19_008058 [Naganishia cerealis]
MARPQARQRYNAKARQSTLGGSSHKKRRKSRVESADHEGEEVEFEGVGDRDDGIEVPDDDDEDRKKQLKLEASLCLPANAQAIGF